MCGIIGYVGKQDIVPILIEGLKKLEYRGYDSAGITLVNPRNTDFQTVKSVGRIAELQKLLDPEPATATIGIAHTR